MRFNLVPPSPLDGRALAVVNRCAAQNLEKRGYLVIDRDMFGAHLKYTLTEKGLQTFKQGATA